MAALHNGRGEAAAYLAERGAYLDLEGAAGTGRIDVVTRYMGQDGTLRGGATKAQLHYGFIWACEYGHTSVVRFLLDRRFKADSNFMQGETGLHWAAYGGHAEIADLLLKANSAVNVKDRVHGGTPLGWALYGWSNPAPEFKHARHHEVVELLVRAGAEVEREWLESPDRGSSLAEKLRADERMRAALRC